MSNHNARASKWFGYNRGDDGQLHSSAEEPKAHVEEPQMQDAPDTNHYAILIDENTSLRVDTDNTYHLYHNGEDGAQISYHYDDKGNLLSSETLLPEQHPSVRIIELDNHRSLEQISMNKNT